MGAYFLLRLLIALEKNQRLTNGASTPTAGLGVARPDAEDDAT